MTEAIYGAWRIYVRGDNDRQLQRISNKALRVFLTLYAVFRALILVMPLPVWLVAWVRHEEVRSWRTERRPSRQVDVPAQWARAAV